MRDSSNCVPLHNEIDCLFLGSPFLPRFEAKSNNRAVLRPDSEALKDLALLPRSKRKAHSKRQIFIVKLDLIAERYFLNLKHKERVCEGKRAQRPEDPAPKPV